MLSGPAAAGEEVPAGLAQLADEVVGVSEEEAARAAVETVSRSGLQVDGERTGRAGCRERLFVCGLPSGHDDMVQRRRLAAAILLF